MISLEREKLLSELEQKIGYSFRSRALLDRALTHRSFANERAAQNCRHNEAMDWPARPWSFITPWTSIPSFSPRRVAGG